MNESGRSIAAAARFFKAPVGAVLVVHDDVDLEEGRLQARLGGGLAGHNGLRSIASALGSQEFLRLRIGVGRPGRGDRRSVADYVLASFEPETRRRRRWSAGRADAVEASVATASRPRSSASTDPHPAQSRHTRVRGRRLPFAPTRGWGVGPWVRTRAGLAASSPSCPRGARLTPAEPAGSAFRHGPSGTSDIRVSPVRRPLPAGRQRASRAPAARRRAGRDERLVAFAAALPAEARVSEPALPLLLAALHLRLERALRLSCCRRTPTRATPPRRPAGTWATSGSALFPSRGVRWGSGLEPPPHLVGERARALDVLAAGGLVCASAAALAERVPPPADAAGAARPRRRRRARNRRSRRAPRARGLRARRAGRGARPVRGPGRDRRRLPDHRPRADPDRALRRRDRGDPRLLAVHAARAATGRAGERPARPPNAGSTSPSRRCRTTSGRRAACARRPRPAVRPRSPTSSSSRTRSRASGRRSSSTPVVARGRVDARSVPARPAVRLRGAAAGGRGPRARRGREGARRRSSAPASGSSSPFRTAATRSAPRTCSASSPSPRSRTGSRASGGRRACTSPSHRPDAASSGAISGSSSCPTRRSSASAHRAATPGSAVRSSRSPTCAPGDYVVHEDHGVGKLLGFETKEVAGVTRDYLFLAFRGDDRLYVPHEQIGKVSRYIGADAKAPALSKLGGKAWQLLKSRARESRAGARRRADRALRPPPDHARRRVRPVRRLARAARGRVPLPRDRGPAARDRGGQGGSGGAEPDGPARLRRRRLRQDRGRRPRRLRRRAERQADADARPDHRARAAALEHLPRALPRLPGQRRDGLAVPQARRGEAGARATSPRARSTC